MRLVPKTPLKNQTPRLYFVHLPKTAGVTLKAFLENHYGFGESLVVDEWKAREMPADELQPYRLLSGHYSSEVLDALGERPDVTLMLVREPVSRLRSWLAHCRRVSHDRYRNMCEGKTDREVIEGPDGYTCRQAHWVARALRDGASYESVPTVDELPALLDRVEIPGITEEIARVMQLIAFTLGWPAPPREWHINRRPEESPETAQTAQDLSDLSDADAQALLEIDTELYRQVAERFWNAYAAMLSTIHPGGVQFSAETARQQPIDLVQGWLRDHNDRSIIRAHQQAVERIDYTGDQEVRGEGWWWRERPSEWGYRWTGPAPEASMVLPPLVAGQDYTITVDAMGAADWETWEQSTLRVNGCPVDVVRERMGKRQPGSVIVRMHARITPEVVAAQRGATRLTFVTATKQALLHVNVLESFDTYNRDQRRVGLAVHRVRIRKGALSMRPWLSLRPNPELRNTAA